MPSDDFESDRPRRNRDDDYDRAPPRRKSNNTVVIVIAIVAACGLISCIPIMIGLLLPAVQKTREAANRMKSANNLKQIGLATLNYDSANNEMPANSYTADGKPLLSWRVHLLPYLEQDNLYRQFNLNEPWDGPTNIRLLNQMPVIYKAPQKPSDSMTHYRGFSNRGAIFEYRAKNQGRVKNGKLTFGLSLRDVQDLHSQTILVVDANEPVEWTKPDDLDASPNKPFPALGGLDPGKKKVQVLWLDASVTFIRTELPESTWRSLITHSGRETLTPGWDD